MFIETPTETTATGDTAAMYARSRDSYGYLPNMVRAFGLRPDVMAGWTALLTSVRTPMEPRRYELVTLAAAGALTSSYCMLAHGSVLLKQGLTEPEVAAIATGAEEAPLTDQERAIMAYAALIARDATSVTQHDIDRLKGTGLTEAEIFDIAAAAAIRCFFSKFLDALGAEPDRAYMSLDPTLRATLTVGRAMQD